MMAYWICLRLILLVAALGIIPSTQQAFVDSSTDISDIQSDGKNRYSDPLDVHTKLLCTRGTCTGRCGNPGRLPPEGEDHSSTGGGANEEEAAKDDSDNDGNEDEDTDNDNGSTTSTNTLCHCDEACVVYGDCCYDFFFLCLQKNLTSLLSSVQNTSGMIKIMQDITRRTSTINESVLMYLYKRCEKIQHDKFTQYFWMISQCAKLNPESLDDGENDIVSKCHNISLDPLGSVPASLRQQPDIVFRNILCAQCNGVDKDKVIMWPSKAKCDGNVSSCDITYDKFIDALSASLCRVESKVPANTEPRPCEQDHDTHLSLCPTHGDDRAFPSLESLMCRSYSYPVVTDKGVKVRNSHCSKCSIKDTFWNFTCDPLTHFRFHNVEMPYCERRSCKGQCNMETADHDCHCDIRCLTYGDCCFDFISTCLGDNFSLTDFADNDAITNNLLIQKLNSDEHDPSTRTTDENQISTTAKLQGLYIRYRRCVHVPQRHLIWAIAKCPQKKEDPLCESEPYLTNHSIFSPVSYIYDTHIVFKNIYCARCHDIPEGLLFQWTISFSCEPPSHSITNITEFLWKHCNLNMDRTGGRSCMKVDIDQQTQIYNDSEDLLYCKSYRYSVSSTSNSTQYRNPHCARLHVDEDVSCTSNSIHASALPREIGPSSSSFSILFNFDDNDVKFQSQTGKIISPYIQCQSNEVYDVYEKICRQIRCQEGKEAVNGTCVVTGLVYADRQNQLFPNGTLHYTVSLYVLTELPLQINNIEDSLILESLFEQADMTTDDIEILNVSTPPGDTSFHGITWRAGQGLRQRVKIHVKKVASLAEDIHAISQLAQRLSKKRDPMIVDIILQNFQSESDLFCSYGAVMHLTNVTLETLNGTLYAVDSYKYYPLESVAFVLGLKNSPPDLQEIFVCGIPLKCDPVVYNLTDFVQEDGNLRNLYSDVILANTSFFIVGDEVLSCHNFTQSGPRRYSQIFFKYDHLQDILTYVTSGVSIVSLLITLVVYSLLPELRNLPGRLTMSLSATLFVAQTLLLLIHLPRGLLCQVLAITLHFSWLCSFMWMTVLSITLARTFTSKGVNSLNQDTARIHGFLSLCAIGIPSIIVTTTALLDFLEVPNIYIGYGAQGICWIANPRASLLVFGVPLALMLLVNIIAFIMTLCNIEKSMKLSKNITSSKKDKAKVFIYGKLFVIMGVSWCSSFGAAFADVNILWYIFIILNGLQGFYIFVSFVCTDRVKRLLRKKFSGSSAQIKTTSAVTASTENNSEKSEKNSI